MTKKTDYFRGFVLGFIKNKPVLVTIIVVIIIILLMALTSGTNKVSEGTTVVGSAFMPLQSFFNKASDSVSSFFVRVFSSEEEDGKSLEELDELRLQLSNYDELVAENERLSEMLDYKQNNPEQELIVAKITGKNPGNWFDVFTIDRGRQHGIEENMPVITPDGLVGRVEEVGLNWAKVMAVVDGRSGVSAIVERTRDFGVVKGRVGTGDIESMLYMEYMELDTDIVEGDVVVTSGLDQRYPKGLVIGEVVETSDESGGKNVLIKPNVDFRRLEEVMVIKTIDEAESVTEEDISDGGATQSAEPTESTDPNLPAGQDENGLIPIED